MLYSIEPDPIRVGQIGSLRIQLEQEQSGPYWFRIAEEEEPFTGSEGSRKYIRTDMQPSRDFQPEVRFSNPGPVYVLSVPVDDMKSPPDDADRRWTESPEVTRVAEPDGGVDFTVSLGASPEPTTADEVLWRFIRAISRRMRFDEFRDYVQPRLPTEETAWHGVNAYDALRKLADEFVGQSASPVAGPELSQSTYSAGLAQSYVHDVKQSSNPYLDYPYGERNQARVPIRFPLPSVPFVELIWNYWSEEGMLVQTLNHILARFQNRRPGPTADPLMRLDLSPLMPLRALLWGFAENETARLTIRRRNAEYEYEYGLRLRGRAIPDAAMLVDRRSQFLEGFHRLLHACVQYYKERDDKTVDADAFPLLSNLQEVHLSLARGAHNQYANLAVTARAEMLTMQWLLAQPEMHEFLGGPVMIPYEEPWMDRVDTMKSMQGWADASITHFFELAVQGEQILLSVRHGRWNESTRKREHAANWALLWRNEIQRYIHSYATVTGVDLAVGVNATMPSELLARRLTKQRRRA